MTTLPRVDDAVARILAIHDSRAGRPLTRSQDDGLSQARRDLSDALADAGTTLGSYTRGLAERAASAEDPDDSERYTRQLRQQADREQMVDRLDGTRDWRGRIESSRPDGYDFDALIKTFRSHGFASVEIEPSEKYTTRALQSAGGSAVPTTFSDSIAFYARTMSPMLDGNVVTLENVATGGPIVFPRLTADASTGGTVTSEGASITVADPTISSVTVQPFGYKLINVWSRELDTDEVIGLKDLIARTTGRQLALSAGAHLTTGTGTTVPWGLVTRAENGGTALGTASGTSSDSYVSPADLIDLKYTRARDVRVRGGYMVSTTMLAKMRKFRDSQGAYMLNPTMGGGVPTFDGSPVWENPSMAAVGSATKAAVFCDASAYRVVRVSPIRIELSLDAYFGTDQVALRVVDRISGDLPDVTAAAYAVSANS